MDFPGPLEEPMMLIGHGVAQRIYRERRNFVTEIIGGEIAPVRQLMEAIKAAGYEIEFAGISCDATAAVESTVDQTALCSRYPARRQGHREPYLVLQTSWLDCSARFGQTPARNQFPPRYKNSGSQELRLGRHLRFPNSGCPRRLVEHTRLDHEWG